jgi:gliding motility-associated-like protein
VNEATPISVVWSPYDSLLCYGATTGELSVEADGGSEFLYNWIPPISIDSMATDLSDGIYEVWVQNESNCIDSLVAEIAEIPAIEVSIVDEGLALCGVSNGYIEVSASGGMGNLDLDWQIDTGPLLWAVESGPYHLHIEDEFGCTWDSTLTVQCLDEIPVGVNQLITPNGDGLNDVLFLEDLYLYPNHMLTVYNRWGKKVYQASPYENDWGGERIENESNPLPSSTYFYLLETGMDEPAFFRGFLEIHTDIR